MNTITIVTGNPGKVRELEAIAAGRLNFIMHDLDIHEIQSLDLEAIVKNKAEQAFDQIKAPVIVEDVSAGLLSLEGLPGPFIKFFMKSLGNDALSKLAKTNEEDVIITCVAAYYDGDELLIGKGSVEGKIVHPRGNNGFGFDSTVLPNGSTKTMAEMTQQEKSQISHRGKAFRMLIEKIEELEKNIS